MMTKWKWVPCEQGYPAIDLVDGNDNVILSIYESHSGGKIPDKEHQQMIEMVPEFLNILERLLTSEDHQDIWLEARSAYAEATGRPSYWMP